MYETYDDQTLGNIYSGNRSHRRTWLTVGIGAVAVLAMVLLVAVACNARADQPGSPLGAPSTPEPTTSAEPTAPPDDEDSDAGSDAGTGGQNPGGQNPGGQNPGGQNPGGQNPGGQNPGGEDPGGEDPDGEDPDGDGDGEGVVPAIPIGPVISATVLNPKPTHCIFGVARAKITVTGIVIAPVEVEYQWIKFGFVDQPLGGVQKVTFDQIGDQTVSSPQLPKNSDGHLVYLKIVSPQELNSDIVLVPGCG